MSEVKRWKLKGVLPGVEGECKAVFQPVVVLAEDLDRVTAERDALQQRLNAADQRIDELERGQVEPFMYGIAQPNGTPHFSELCVSGEASDLEGEVEAMNEDGDGFRIVALFSAPPAPVAVVLPERKTTFITVVEGAFLRGWNACLDATAALNTPK